MFLIGSGGGIYSLEWIKSETNIGNLENAWFVLAMFGMLFGAAVIIWGILLSVESLRYLQNDTKRRNVGWFFSLCGIGGAIYLLQYLAMGILPWWNQEGITRSAVTVNFWVGIMIGIEYLFSLLFCGIIVYAGWKIARAKDILQLAPQPPDEPAEQ